jgi:LysM repeat protein
VSQQTNLEENDTSLVLEDSWKSEQDEGIVMTPSVSMISEESATETSLEEESPSQPEERRESIEYTIKEGDTISAIASAFGLKTQTLLWANNLKDWSIIKPGDSITVPPKDGVIYEVKLGDTLSGVAQKYQTEVNEICEWNQLDVDKIVEGQEIFLPNATMVATRAASTSSASSTASTGASTFSEPAPVYSSNSGCHSFPYGYCTWYVAQKRGCVPWGGNAKDWLSNAQAYGYNVCWGSNCSCPAGSILVTRESWWGHVAFVESSNASTITISEMNKYGWGKVSTRTLNKGAWVIRGCIY